MDFEISDLTKMLVEKNLKPSFQRLKILEYLMKKNGHPTVDEIYVALSPGIPTLSKTTVYNTLNAFIEADIVRILNIESNETRYDAILDEHGHFKCNQCGKIYDLKINTDNLKIKNLPGFVITEKDVFLKGICRDCSDKNRKLTEN